MSLVIEEKIEFFYKEDTTKYLESSIKECLMKNNKVYQEKQEVFIHVKYEFITMKDGNNWLTNIR